MSSKSEIESPQSKDQSPKSAPRRRQPRDFGLWTLDFGPKRSAARRDAFSLLEVVLALAILTVTVAVLGELIRAGLRNAQVARDLSQAELICESTIYQLESGLLPAQPVAGAAAANAPGWFYSIQAESSGMAGQAGLFQFRITAEQDPDRFARPVRFSVVRWMRDPSLVLAQQAIQQTTLPTVSSGSSSTSGTGVF
jgi:general secretion pathway protein I